MNTNLFDKVTQYEKMGFQIISASLKNSNGDIVTLNTEYSVSLKEDEASLKKCNTTELYLYQNTNNLMENYIPLNSVHSFLVDYLNYRISLVTTPDALKYIKHSVGSSIFKQHKSPIVVIQCNLENHKLVSNTWWDLLKESGSNTHSIFLTYPLDKLSIDSKIEKTKVFLDKFFDRLNKK